MTTIHIPRPWRVVDARSTPEAVYWDRRGVLRAMGLGGALLAAPRWARGDDVAEPDPALALAPALGERFAGRFPAPRDPAFTLGGRPLTAETVASRYNNFYEFTTDKDRVWQLAHGYDVDPWKVEVGGLVATPRTFDLDDLFAFPLEERLYRFRCVERWAMQVPWTGFPLRALLDRVEPLSTARWVRFVSVHDPEGMVGQRKQRWYPWPYYEALRLDEAMHELTLVALGIYGHALPMQHGAPLRLVVPWKYGYKGAKSVVKIELVAERPHTFWNDSQPEEYGFFSNVDPSSPHPRWPQHLEKDIGTGETRETLPWNGYGEQVASMYRGGES